MTDLRKLTHQRKAIERKIRKKERDLLKPYVGEKCLSTTFLECVEGTVEALSNDDTPRGYSKADLYQLVLRNKGWNSLRGDLKKIESEYEIYLENRGLLDTEYKNQIIAIKREYGHSLSNSDIAKFVGCSAGFARKFTPSHSEEGSVYEQYPPESQVNDKLRREILKRDDSCVRCQSSSDLEVHHIIPAIQGGKATVDNLATLCHDCHVILHNIGLQNKTRDGFWSWVKNTSSK